jgi:Leucine-rich repeat (LRR) protein
VKYLSTEVEPNNAQATLLYLLSLAMVIHLLVIVTEAEENQSDVSPCLLGCCQCDPISKSVSCWPVSVSRIPSNLPEWTSSAYIHVNSRQTAVNVIMSSFAHLSHLIILSLSFSAHIEKGAFHTLCNLRSLYLSGNELGLHDNSQALFGIYNVETLDLSDNLLTLLPNLSSATKVMSLDLSGNLLTSIPDLGILHNLVHLDIAGNQLKNDNFPAGFKKLRYFSKITIGNSQLENFTLKGWSNVNRKSITEINFSNFSVFNLPVFEQKFFEMFSNLRKLSLPVACDKSIETIFTELSSVKTLVELQLSGYSYSDTRSLELSKHLFTPLNTTSLTVFSLDWCRIKVIRNDTFVPVNSLHSLSISHGKIDSIEPGAFNELNKLEIMYLNESLGQNQLLCSHLPVGLRTIVLTLRKWKFPSD